MKNNYSQFNLFRQTLRACALTLLLAVSSGICGASSTDEIATGAVTEMDHMLAAAFHPDAPGAAVLVVLNGKAILRRAYGLADLEHNVPMSPANVFPVCSITKQFTAVGILQLVQAGKLKLDDDLDTFVPDYPTDNARVTLTQLLSHTSGIPSVEEQPDWRKSWGEDLTPNQVLDFTRNKPLAFVPGSNFKYSNTGYILLGQVIEKASGQSYPDYVRSHLIAPAAMAHSYCPDGNHVIAGRVNGYSPSGNNWVGAPHFSMLQAYSAGALQSTVDDMWAWEQALESGRLVNASLLEKAYVEGHLPDGRDTHYGFGWEINKLGRHNVIEHGGGMPGFAAYEARVPDAGIYIVILSNTDEPTVPLRTLAANLVKVALGETDVAPTSLPVAGIEDFMGAYQIGGSARFIITAKDNVLYGQLGPGQRPLKAIAPDQFMSPGGEMRFNFVRDAARQVQKVLVRTDGPGPELVWLRVEAP